MRAHEIRAYFYPSKYLLYFVVGKGLPHCLKILTCWSTPTASRPSYMMSTQPSLDAKTNRDIKAWQRGIGKTMLKRKSHIHWGWLIKWKNVGETKPVQGCQSCTCVWPICSWPADSRTCWWCCAHPPLDKRKTFPWRAAGKHADESFIWIYSRSHANLILSVCFSPFRECVPKHTVLGISPLHKVTQGADTSASSLTTSGASCRNTQVHHKYMS